MDAVFFDACAPSLRPGVSRWVSLWLRLSLHWRLRPHAHGPSPLLFPLRVGRRLRILPRARRLRLAHGGSLVAPLGGGGAGEAACTAELARWLGTPFDVRTAHLRRPPR